MRSGHAAALIAALTVVGTLVAWWSVGTLYTIAVAPILFALIIFVTIGVTVARSARRGRASAV